MNSIFSLIVGIGVYYLTNNILFAMLAAGFEYITTELLFLKKKLNEVPKRNPTFVHPKGEPKPIIKERPKGYFSDAKDKHQWMKDFVAYEESAAIYKKWWNECEYK